MMGMVLMLTMARLR